MADAEATPAKANGSKIAKAKRDQMGSNLAKLRKERALSQTQLAEALLKPNGQPYHFTYVGNIERGTNSPSRMFIRAAAEFFGVEPEALLASGVEMDDLGEGVIRAPRGSRASSRRRARQATAATSEAPVTAKTKTNGHKGELVGLSLDNGILKIVTEKATMTVEGEFDGTIEGGRLRLAS